MVSAPVGFGRLHVSPVMSAYLKRYAEVAGELRLEDRVINLVEDGVDLAVRIGHLADSSLVARHVGEMRRIVVASPGYLKRAWRAEDARGDRFAPDDSIRRHGAPPDWRFVDDGREIRVMPTPRFLTNSADAAIQYAEAGGGLTRVLFYQAADAIRRGRLKIVLQKFEQPPLPIHLVYPTSRLLSAKVRTFIDLVTEISRLAFWVSETFRQCGQTRHARELRSGRLRVDTCPGMTPGIADAAAPERALSAAERCGHSSSPPRGTSPLARAITTSSALTRLCAKQSVLPVWITSGSTASHCPICAEPMKSTASPIVTSEDAPPITCAQL